MVAGIVTVRLLLLVEVDAEGKGIVLLDLRVDVEPRVAAAPERADEARFFAVLPLECVAGPAEERYRIVLEAFDGEFHRNCLIALVIARVSAPAARPNRSANAVRAGNPGLSNHWIATFPKTGTRDDRKGE